MKKAAEIMRFQRLVGCGRRTRTSDLRVMSCGLDRLSSPLRAFACILPESKTLFEPICSIGSIQSEPRMGHGLGLQNTNMDWLIENFILHSGYQGTFVMLFPCAIVQEQYGNSPIQNPKNPVLLPEGENPFFVKSRWYSF